MTQIDDFEIPGCHNRSKVGYSVLMVECTNVTCPLKDRCSFYNKPVLGVGRIATLTR
jgi:hypothetical protein